MSGLLESIILRPYVFAFLLAYLFLAWIKWGWRRTLVWLVTGYFIAWLSEYSSIHNSFPYGEYHYVYENLKGELLILGVPFFDSLSYPFLIFAGFTTAETFFPNNKTEFTNLRTYKFTVFVGAFLTMLLDVIIDPIATMGDKWFLGQIHYYAHPGWYFGVPFTNFAGWFLVSFAVIACNVLLWHIFEPLSRWSMVDSRWHKIFYPAFYAGIAIFNIFISFWVGQWRLGIASSIILLIILATIAVRHALPAHLFHRTK